MMRHLYLIFALSLSISMPVWANPTSFSVLNGSYHDVQGQYSFIFDGTKKAGFAEGSVCEFDGKLSQPVSGKLDFIYKNTSHDGTIDNCQDPKPFKIHVLSVNPKTGIATKFNITASQSDRVLNGRYTKTVPIASK